MSAEGAIVERARLLRPIDRRHDHARGGTGRGAISVVTYGDYLCPYCRRLSRVLARLRETLGERMVYVFRHFPNEKAHPGATLLAQASEAASKQGKFWEMHDAIYAAEPPLVEAHIDEIATSLGLDMARFKHDLTSAAVRNRVDEDVAEGRRNGVTGTPTIFVDGVRYDGAWDFHAMLEAVDRPVGARVKRTARAFASLPASGGLMLLAAAVAAMVCANSPAAAGYTRIVSAMFGVGPTAQPLAMSVADWVSEGLLSVFFLLVGLEIRREMTAGALNTWRAALLPVVAAMGGALAPALIYLALNPGPTAGGWSVATATNIAFALGIMAVLGRRVSAGLKVFVAAFAVIDDLISIGILAVFYPRDFQLGWLVVSALCVGAMATLSRWRVYAVWPYLIATIGLWVSLHLGGVQAALTGVLLAAFLPTRPEPAAGPLLAQAANALAELEHAEQDAKKAGVKRRLDQEPVWDWATRNLTAASERLSSPAERVEASVAPWSTYLVLPLFAFSAAGIPLAADFGVTGGVRELAGVVLGLAIGKPLGICLASLIAIRARLATAPQDAGLSAFLGAAFLCGFGDTFSLLMADRAFPNPAYAAIAKIGVLGGSALAAALGVAVLLMGGRSMTPAAKTKP